MGWRCKSSKQSALERLKKNRLLVATLVAVVVGIALGFGLRSLSLSGDAITWIGIWGELFLRMLRMLILPLILSSLVVGVASMNSSFSGKLGTITLVYILTTQFVPLIVGAMLVAIIKPGRGFENSVESSPVLDNDKYSDIFADLLRNIFPDNIVKACIQSVYTSVHPTTVSDENSSAATNGSLSAYNKVLLHRDSMNIMGIVTFGLMTGAAMSSVGPGAEPLLNVFVSLNKVVLKMMNLVVWYSPIGICSLIICALLKVESMNDIFRPVGLLVVTVTSACFIHQFVLLPLLYLFVCRKNPYAYFLGMIEAYLAAFSTTTSLVALPYIMTIGPAKYGMDRRVPQFVLPIAVTTNKDGSAIFIYIATVFIAQSYSISLTFTHHIILIFLICILAPAVAATPSSSIVVLMLVASTVGLPVDDRLGLIMAVEWLNDRIRTGTNTAGHVFGCAIIDSLFKKFIEHGQQEKSPSSMGHPATNLSGAQQYPREDCAYTDVPTENVNLV